MEREEMRKAVILIPILAMMLVAPAMAKPETITINMNQAQYQWRGVVEPTDWWSVYQNSPSPSDYTLTGNVLHTSWSYSPLVTDLHGNSTTYVFDKKTNL
ncbi:MAG: hypothetical protein NTY03_03250 [Candidatus Bathyarchaeota archaeon]|nr:hypothetical protein [Candidatus Bathyarchaeota archaeon]